MNRLLSNPVANMYGPHFLLLYLILCCLVIGIALYVARRVRENAGPMASPVQADPDPYSLAFLREGPDEVIRLAFVSLVQKGHLEIVQQNRWYGSWLNLVRVRNPGSDPLSELEQEVLRAIGGSEPDSVLDCQPAKLRKVVRDFCDGYQSRLEEQSLLAPADLQWAAFKKMLPLGILRSTGR